MQFFVLGGLTITALWILVLGGRGYRQRLADLGTVSDGWIANHRTSRYDPNR